MRQAKVKEYLGHTCVTCKTQGRSRPKLARMTCAAFHSQRLCNAFVCFEHGHTQAGLTVCNECCPRETAPVVPGLRGQQLVLDF